MFVLLIYSCTENNKEFIFGITMLSLALDVVQNDCDPKLNSCDSLVYSLNLLETQIKVWS